MRTISHYRLEQELGRGGMGRVYKALDLTLNRAVVLKLLGPELVSDAASRNRFDMEGTLTCERIMQAAREDDDLARAVLQETGVFLGMALASTINLLNVEMVVIGGGVMTSGEVLIEPIREETSNRTIPPAFNCCRIVAGSLGQDAGIIGAAMLARDAGKASPN